jgi:hypothetical protein
MSRSLARPHALVLSALLASPALLIACCAQVEAPSPQPLDAGAPDVGPPDAGTDAPAPRDSGLGAEAFAIGPRETDLAMRAGSSRALEIDIARAEGFDAPIAIDALGLPAGIRLLGTMAGAGVSVATVVLEADPGAETQRPLPFTLQASAEGWQRRARITLTVTP